MDARVRGLMMKIFPLSLSLLATAKQIGSGSVVSDRLGDLLPEGNFLVLKLCRFENIVPFSKTGPNGRVRQAL